jgi:hypothetical protein
LNLSTRLDCAVDRLTAAEPSSEAMKPQPLTSATVADIHGRVAKLRPDSVRKWGKLEPVGMVCHMARVMEISLGDHPVEDRSNFITRSRLVRWLVLETLPWPKGRIKAPSFFTPAPEGELEDELKALLAAMERFAREMEANPDRRVTHPVFGPLTLRYWGVLHGLHFDHHCRQFGV